MDDSRLVGSHLFSEECPFPRAANVTHQLASPIVSLEYYALSDAGKEGVWLRSVLEELGHISAAAYGHLG